MRPGAPTALTAEQRTAKEEELATAEGQAQSYMQYVISIGRARNTILGNVKLIEF